MCAFDHPEEAFTRGNVSSGLPIWGLIAAVLGDDHGLKTFHIETIGCGTWEPTERSSLSFNVYMNRGALTAPLRAGKEPGFATQCDAAQRALRRIV
jgi:hypothetical protein